VGDVSAEDSVVPAGDSDVAAGDSAVVAGLVVSVVVGGLVAAGRLRLLLARRKERGTGQDADVFFHSVNWKSHIALTDKSEQGSF